MPATFGGRHGGACLLLCRNHLWRHDGNQARQITDHPMNDFWPRLARANASRLWIVWDESIANRGKHPEGARSHV
ncbi:MAG: hypothetical protein GXX96_12830 [Planctomycetaceae bacterium]|nr:hypothetical protein [Planctomycetaceae bacterium]